MATGIVVDGQCDCSTAPAPSISSYGSYGSYGSNGSYGSGGGMCTSFGSFQASSGGRRLRQESSPVAVRGWVSMALRHASHFPVL